MDWEKIVEQIPTAIEKVRTDYVLNNMIIKDDIFWILEKHCTVVYYPIEDEINCGFHTKRFVKDKLVTNKQKQEYNEESIIFAEEAKIIE